jgi:D-alanine-D-alanine ligase
MSAQSAQLIQKALLTRYQNVCLRVVNTRQEASRLIEEAPDLVFLGMKHLPAEPRKQHYRPVLMATLLEEGSISFTGSSAQAVTLDANKSAAKTTISAAGLQTARHKKSGRDDSKAVVQLRYPLFVKPDNLGGSLGVDEDSVVHTAAEMNAKVASIMNRFGTKSIIEEYLPGREFSVALLASLDGGSPTVVPLEITMLPDKNGNRILSQAVKREDSEVVSLIKNKELNSEMIQFAWAAFQALGARDYGRIDIRLDSKGQPHFIEANLMPGLGGGYYSRAFRLSGRLRYDQMILQIAELGLQRRAAAASWDINQRTQPRAKPIIVA